MDALILMQQIQVGKLNSEKKFKREFLKLEKICFTMLRWFLPYNNISQRKYAYVPSLLNHPTPPDCHGTVLSSLFYSATFCQLLVLYTVMYVFQCYSLNSSHPLLLLLCSQVFSLRLRLYSLPWKQIHQYHFSRFHVNVLIYFITKIGFFFFVIRVFSISEELETS